MLKRVISFFTGKTYKLKYRIGKRIFDGPFSNIYEAERRSDGQRAALKILTESGEKIARLLRDDPNSMWEGQILLTLNHPNIVEGYDCDDGKEFWIAMEHLNYPLNTYIARFPELLSEEDFIEISYGIARAVNYIHKKGLVHRDIATDNVMLKEKTPKLIDFGMTVPIGSNVIKGRVGTPSYMAPEMIKKKEYTPGGDIYSLGMVMYEIVTGTKPFGGEMKENRMTKALNMTPMAPSSLGKPCSKELEKLIMSCISKNPYQRPTDTYEVVERLGEMKKKKSGCEE